MLGKENLAIVGQNSSNINHNDYENDKLMTEADTDRWEYSEDQQKRFSNEMRLFVKETDH